MNLLTNYQVSVTLVHMSCGECGIQFAMPEDKYNRCKQKGEDWYCPNGHCRVFTKTDNQQLKDRISELERSNQYLRDAKDNLHNKLTHEKQVSKTYKGHVTRIKNRVKNGVCPCCNRTFQDLQRHMTTQHPEYK